MPPKKDPLKPKGRTSAYAFFVQEKKEYNKANGINLDFTGFSQCCSEDWKKLSQEKKKKYFDLAEVDKARYDREMKEYRALQLRKEREGRRNKKIKMHQREECMCIIHMGILTVYLKLKDFILLSCIFSSLFY